MRPDVLHLQVTTPTDLSDLAATHQPAGGKKSLVFTCSLEGKCCWQCQGLHEDPFNRSIRYFVSVTFSVQTASMSSVSLHLELKCSFGPRRPRAPSTRANEQVIRHQMFFCPKSAQRSFFLQGNLRQSSLRRCGTNFTWPLSSRHSPSSS